MGNQDDRAVTPRDPVARLREERGQTLSEYLMIVGLLTAIIISLTQIIVPSLSFVIVHLVQFMSVHLTSVPG
jgi:Flp pilus assembly pilin Flp